MNVCEGQRLDRLGQSVFWASVSPVALFGWILVTSLYYPCWVVWNHTETYYHRDKGSLIVSYSFQDKEVSLTTDQ